MNPLRVALIYNQKKEETAQQISSDDLDEPPSSQREAFLDFSLKNLNHHQSNIHNVSDMYAEWDTFETIDAVRSALAELHDVTLIEADKYAYQKLMVDRPDIVFNIAEGFHGASREAQIPAMLEMLNIPYTGSDPLTLSICLDKSRAKEILSYHKIPTPKFTVINGLSEIVGKNILYPSIVKPLYEGSSKGIFNSSVVRNEPELYKAISIALERYHEPVIVEEYLKGREFTVAILGNGEDAIILPIVEIKFDTLPSGVNPIYSYEAKWIWDKAESPLDIFSCPASITSQLKSEIENISLKAYKILRCRDWCRIDIRCNENEKPYILELNPLPGILPKPEDNSCFPKAARAAGMTYKQLIQTVLFVAAKRYGLINLQTLYKNQLEGVT